ncbi:MAG: alpha-amylase, partial [Cereibacter sp.]
MARAVAAAEDDIFALRLDRSAADLWGMTDRLYASHPGYPKFRAALLKAMRAAWAARPAALKRLDLQRDLEPDWFQRPGMA